MSAASPSESPPGAAEPQEHGFQDRAPPDRFCDLVLTGGVTSAIAYPALIFTLAQAYRFHGLGGSSSGAGTAALAAAAEYRRRRGSNEGFRTLLRGALAVREDAVPSMATQAAPATTATPATATLPHRGTQLSWLFQPDAELQTLFDAIAPGIAGGQWWRAGAGLLRAYATPVLLASLGVFALLGGVLWLNHWWSLWTAATAAFTALVVGLVHGVLHGLWPDVQRFIAQDFGLCGGQQALPGAPHPPLTAWLHDLVQQVAGRSAEEAPLTFGDLHQVRGGPQALQVQPPSADGRAIDLRIYAANISLGRPVVFPQPEPSHAPPPTAAGASAWAAWASTEHDTLYFKPCELQPLFPPAVLQHLMAHSAPAPGQCETAPMAQCWVLPRSQLPVVVAARISVSFPVLFKAVPLWVRPRQTAALAACPAPPVAGAADGFERCLFADGSLCSSFPVHLFDSLLPAWPTFGVALVDRPDLADYRDPAAAAARMVHLPEASSAVGQARWFAPAAAPRAPLARLAGFVGAMLGTVMHWHDKALAEFPGARERVVQLGLPPGIGGLNIFMDRAQIEYLARLGLEGAKLLVARYALPDEAGGTARGWRQHRWLRLNLLCEALQTSLAGVAAAERARYSQRLWDQLDSAAEQPPLGEAGDSPLSPAEVATLQAWLAALAQFEQTLGALPTESRRPLAPQPVLRVLPPS